MIVDSKKKQRFVTSRYNEVRFKLLNKKSRAETHFAKLLVNANIYFNREKGNYKMGTRWCYYDFYLPLYRLYIELDGTSHNNDKQQKIDKQKANIICKRKCSLIRYTNDEVLKMDSISIEDILERAFNAPSKISSNHSYFNKSFFMNFDKGVEFKLRDIKSNLHFDIDETSKVYMYDNLIGDYFCFDNIYDARLNLPLSINEIASLLSGYEYGSKDFNRRYIFGWSLSECEINVMNAYC